MGTAVSFIGDTTYALLLYLLYATDDMLQKTTYYVGKTLAGFPLSPKVVMSPINPYNNKNLIKYRIRCLKYRFRLKRTAIYAQDHLPFSAPLIDNLPYTVLEDCPNFFTVLDSHQDESSYRDSFNARRYNFCVGRLLNRHGGFNPYCINRIVTTNSDRLLFERMHLQVTLCDLKLLWQEASSYKKELVLNAFGIKNQTDEISHQIILFSQPLISDCHFSVDEQVAIYKPYIDRFGAERILVKLHPRDHFDYAKYFPGIAVLKTNAPQQLLSLMGVSCKTAITVCSSAVSSLGNDTEIIWIGAEADERIVKAYGHVKCPRNE